MAHFSSPGASSFKATDNKQALWQAGCWAPVHHFCLFHFTALCPCPRTVICHTVSVGTYQSKHQLWPKHTCQCSCQEGAYRLIGRGGRRGRHVATVDYPWYGYMSTVGQPPFSLEERNAYFEKLTWSLPDPTTSKTVCWPWWMAWC